MTEVLTCAEVRELGFEHRRGELGEPARALVDTHLAHCDTCATYLGNLDALLTSASCAETLPDGAIDRIWAGLAQTLPESGRHRDSGPPARGRLGRLAIIMLVAATAVILGAAAWGLWPDPSEPPAGTLLEEAPGVSSPVAHRTEHDRAPAQPEATPEPGPLVLSPQRLHPGVLVFAPADAEWSFDALDDVHIDLRNGTLLIEVVPGQATVLVDLPGRRVEVVGTVLLVSVDDTGSAVSVAAGTVRVMDRQGVALTLEEGSELGPTGLVGPVSAVRRALIEAHVDLPAHRALTAARAAVAPAAHERSGPQGRASHESRADDPATGSVASEMPRPAPDYLTLAEQAQREGRYVDAAALLETLIRADVSAELEVGLARLDLARLYESRLDRPQRALEHLRQFLAEHPSDPAARSVRLELCELSRQLFADEPGCTP